MAGLNLGGGIQPAADHYRDFRHLQRHVHVGRDYVILSRPGTSDLAVIAIHGGGIEPGTVDIADAVAGEEHAFYAFKGIKPSGNADLHITSNRFDEPLGLRIVGAAETVVSIHGCREAEAVVFVGGRHRELKDAIGDALTTAGFAARESRRPGLRGINPANICNRCRAGAGVQLEISEGLRHQMLAGLRHRTLRRRRPRFYRFVDALRRVLTGAIPGLRKRC